MKEGSSGFLEKIVPSEILQVKPYVPGKPIEEVKRELGLSKVIKLASNENPLGPSPEAVEAICRYASQVHLYPDGDCYYLKRELALHLEVEPDNIILGNGSDEIVSILTRVFIQEGKEAIMGYPSFLMYKIDTQLARGKIICVPLNDFKIDIDAIIKAINSNTRIIFISNPNNPTGTIVTREKMQELVENIPPWVLVVCDEAYYEYVEDSLYPDSLRWVKEGKNVVVLRTFSKIYGLAGLRIGYGVARKEIISILNRARPPFNVNLLALIKEEKKFLYTKLKELGVEFVPSQTNFILIRTGNKTEEIINNLLKKGIIVRGMQMQAYNLPDYIRLTIGTREENEFFIQEFRKTFR